MTYERSQFNPCLYKPSAGAPYFFPQPLNICDFDNPFKKVEHSNPYQVGGIFVASVSGAVKIQVGGNLNKVDGDVVYTDDQFVSAIVDMRDYLTVEDDEMLEFYFWYDPDGGIYLKYTEVAIDNFHAGLGEDVFNEWAWAVSFTAYNPALLTTGPPEP